MIFSRIASSPVRPGFSTTALATISDPGRFGSGRPIVAALSMSGCSIRTSSTTRVNTLKPETLTMSFSRSTMVKYPSSSMTATSPV